MKFYLMYGQVESSDNDIEKKFYLMKTNCIKARQID